MALCPSGDPEVSGPCDLIFTRGNPDEEEDDVDSDTDDIDHHGKFWLWLPFSV